MPFTRRAPPTWPGSKVLLLLPPFAGIDRPSLGLHVLQACARERGYDVSVVYANMSFAAEIGVDLYNAICYAPTEELLGEHIFSPVAYGGKCTSPTSAQNFRRVGMRDVLAQHHVKLNELQTHARNWVQRFTSSLATSEALIVGCNTTFEQTAASVAILGALKVKRPSVTTLIGGANCEGQMAEGIATLAPKIDFIFESESEHTFPAFLDDYFAKGGSTPRIVKGKPNQNLSSIPCVDYDDYYSQLQELLRQGVVQTLEHSWLPYESSRGCWWGQKHHCTFCGINGQGMVFRQKSASQVMTELEALLDKHPSNKVLMVDNIMPTNYFADLLPALQNSHRKLHIFYEQKANLTLKKVHQLKSAGIAIIQPGIEALSTSLLKRMKKGVTGPQNIALLRYAKSVGLAVNWNLLYAFPGDQEEDYEETIKLLPLIRHLNPPVGVSGLSIDRFSPYFDQSDAYGISGLSPMSAYSSVLPEGAEVAKIAYHFVGEYDCAHKRSPELACQTETHVASWRAEWTRLDEAPPALAIEKIDDDTFLLIDSRNRMEGRSAIRFLTFEQARVSLCLLPRHLVGSDLQEWAVGIAKVSVHIDQMMVPLATAEFSLLAEMERLSRADIAQPSAQELLMLAT